MKSFLVATHVVFCYFLFYLVFGSTSGNLDQAFIVSLITAAATIGSAVAKAKQEKKNQQFQQGVREDQIAAENQRRENFGAEFANLIDGYNQLREERPGLEVKDFIRDIVEALGSEELKKEFNEASEFEFNLAQDFADRATKSNLSTLELAQQEVSNGKFDEILDLRNEIALTDDSQSRVNRAIELAAPALSAGSVQLGSSENPFINRGDAKIIRVAQEEATQARNEQFAKLFSLTEADRNIAVNQQEKAKEFLPQSFLDFKGLATGIAEKSIDERIAFQKFDEAAQLSLAQQFSALGASSTTPNFT